MTWTLTICPDGIAVHHPDGRADLIPALGLGRAVGAQATLTPTGAAQWCFQGPHSFAFPARDTADAVRRGVAALVTAV